jgi:hypothetical protein
LISKIQSGESKGAFALSAIIGGTKSGKLFLAMLTRLSRQDDPRSVKALEPRQVWDEGLAAIHDWQTEGFDSKVGSGAQELSKGNRQEIRIWHLIIFERLKCDFGSNICFYEPSRFPSSQSDSSECKNAMIMGNIGRNDQPHNAGGASSISVLEMSSPYVVVDLYLGVIDAERMRRFVSVSLSGLGKRHSF